MSSEKYPQEVQEEEYGGEDATNDDDGPVVDDGADKNDGDDDNNNNDDANASSSPEQPGREEPPTSATSASAHDDDDNDNEDEEQQQPVVKLYKSTRLKGYMTLVLASSINYDAAQRSADFRDSNLNVVPSTPSQRRYAVAVAIVSMTLSIFCLLVHLLDRFKCTPFRKLWRAMFRDGSKAEGLLLCFMSIWWAVGTGVGTSVTGIAGDGKGQYSLYYSYWVCCLTSLWALEKWWVAAGWVSVLVVL